MAAVHVIKIIIRTYTNVVSYLSNTIPPQLELVIFYPVGAAVDAVDEIPQLLEVQKWRHFATSNFEIHMREESAKPLLETTLNYCCLLFQSQESRANISLVACAVAKATIAARQDCRAVRNSRVY